MGDSTKRLFFVLLLLGGTALSPGGHPAGAQEKKEGPEVRMPRRPLPPEALITLDFQDVDLNVLIKFIGEVTGRNFVVSDQVKGKVTIISPKRIPVREAYLVFESVLDMYGYMAVKVDDAYKIIPTGTARTTGLELHLGKQAEAVRGEDRMITQIIPLEFALADDLRSLFAPLISKDGAIVSYRPTNHLIITERASNIRRLLRIVEQIDTRTVEGRISVFHLEFASARSLAEKLTQLISAETRVPPPTRPPAPPGAPSQRVVKIIPDERTNALVVLANNQDTEEIRRLLEQLDREAPRGKSQLHVRYLEHARADELAKVLNSIMTGRARAPQRAPAGPPPPGAPLSPEEAMITADKATNSLVITASPQDFRELEEVIRKLDTVRSQVLVEALIAEVTMQKALQIGVDWRLMDQPVEGSVRGFGGTDFGLISGVQSGKIPAQTSPDTGLVLGIARGFLTLDGKQVVNLGALIRAFQKDTDANILLTPQLLTMDNEKAKIVVAENVPILKTDLTTPLAAPTPTATSISLSRTFEYRDIGIQLEITPHISTGSMVQLEIAIEVSNLTSPVDPANPGFITTRKRQANTTVAVENGQMVVIGGLIRDDRSDQTRKVPCVGNLPLVGWLFKSYGGDKAKTNLLVFITPHIIRSKEDLERTTNRKKQEAEENLRKLKKEREQEVKDTIDLLLE